jgi:hypothetical protein
MALIAAVQREIIDNRRGDGQCNVIGTQCGADYRPDVPALISPIFGPVVDEEVRSHRRPIPHHHITAACSAAHR